MKKDLNKTNEQLSFELNDLRKKSNKREEMLKEANQQLLATEQQLRAANQQLIAGEHELKKEKIFSEKIVETASAIIVGVDKDHIIRIFNKGAEDITGYTKVEVVGKDWFKIFFPKEVLEKMNKMWRNAWGVNSHSDTNSIFSKEGKEIIVSWQTTGMYENEDDSKHLLLSIGEDITERIQTEKILITSKESYKNIFDSNPLSLCEGDWSEAKELLEQEKTKGITINKEYLDENPEFFKQCILSVKVLQVNKAILDLFKFKNSAEMINNISNIFNERTTETIKKELISIANDEFFFKEETELLDSDGNLIIAIVQFKTVGSYKTVIFSVFDITERKQAEEKASAANQQLLANEQQLKASNQQLEAFNQQLAATEQQLRATNIELSASEQRFRKYFEQSLIGMTITSTEKGWIEINDVLCKMLGYTKEELRKMTWVELTHPDDLEADLSQFNRMLANEIDSYILEKRFIHKDGQIVHIVISVNAYRNMMNQSVEYVLALIHDITERKQAEEKLQESETRFKALHNASFGGIAIHDKGLILDCNKGLSEMTGFEIDELIGMDGLLLIAEESREMVMRNILSAYEKSYESIGIRKNGEKYPIQLDAKQIPYKGKTVRVVEFRDITEHKRAEKALKKRMNELEIFNEATVGRELKMIELKKEINELLIKTGQKPKYEIVE